MQKLILILACVPITPIVLGVVAFYRRWTRKRENTEIIAASAIPIVE